MIGSGLTRYQPTREQGGSGLKSFASQIFKDVASEAKGEARREGWKSLKSGGPWGLPSFAAGVRGVKRGAIRGAKRGVKRKATAAIDIANASAKCAINDLFG